MSSRATFGRFKRSKEGRNSVVDDQRPGRPSKSRTNDTVAIVREKIRNERPLTVREVANEVGISIEHLRATCPK